MTVTYVQEPVGDYIGLYSGRRFLSNESKT